MTLTREPSSRRASQIGEASSTRRPTWLTIRWQMFISCEVVAKADVGELDLAADLDEAPRRPVDHDVGDVVAGKQRLERTEAEDVVADVVEQVLLLGDRQHQILDRDDLVDDVADFLARALRVELGERREIDRLDQRAEDQRFGLKIGVRLPFGLNRRRPERAQACGASARRAHGATRGPASLGAAVPRACRTSLSFPCACAGAERARGEAVASRSFLLAPEFRHERFENASPGLARLGAARKRAASSTKICAVLPFGSISAIICPLLAAEPNSLAS